MSVLLRSLLVLSVTSLFMVGCGEKAAAPAEETPAPVTNPAVAPAEPVAQLLNQQRVVVAMSQQLKSAFQALRLMQQR